jgi:hypothetical protein
VLRRRCPFSVEQTKPSFSAATEPALVGHRRPPHPPSPVTLPVLHTTGRLGPGRRRFDKTRGGAVFYTTAMRAPRALTACVVLLVAHATVSVETQATDPQFVGPQVVAAARFLMCFLPDMPTHSFPHTRNTQAAAAANDETCVVLG